MKWLPTPGVNNPIQSPAPQPPMVQPPVAPMAPGPMPTPMGSPMIPNSVPTTNVPGGHMVPIAQPGPAQQGSALPSGPSEAMARILLAQSQARDPIETPMELGGRLASQWAGQHALQQAQARKREQMLADEERLYQRGLADERRIYDRGLEDESRQRAANMEDFESQMSIKQKYATPKDARTTAMKEYDFAKEQGFEGTFAEYDQQSRKAAAANVNVGFNEGQGKSAGFADRMIQSEAILQKYEQAGTSLADRAAADVPGAGNYLTSDEYKMFEQAKRDFTNAILRKESGAVIGPSEFESADKQYFPQPGDTPEVIAQKRANREVAIDGMVRTAGPGYEMPAPPPAIAAPDAPGAPTPTQRRRFNPETGEIE